MNQTHYLIQCKLLNLLYYTPVLLNRFDPTVSAECRRCRRDGADFMYLTWECFIVASFWNNVKVIIEDIIEQPADFTPLIMVLAIWLTFLHQCEGLQPVASVSKTEGGYGMVQGSSTKD
mgnify:CR=1 FL=1